MKHFVNMAAALAIVTALVTPSIAFAAPAVQALSLSNAAVQPVRAAAKSGKKLKANDNTALIIVGALTVAGGVCAVACGGSKSD